MDKVGYVPQSPINHRLPGFQVARERHPSHGERLSVPPYDPFRKACRFLARSSPSETSLRPPSPEGSRALTTLPDTANRWGQGGRLSRRVRVREVSLSALPSIVSHVVSPAGVSDCEDAPLTSQQEDLVTFARQTNNDLKRFLKNFVRKRRIVRVRPCAVARIVPAGFRRRQELCSERLIQRNFPLPKACSAQVFVAMEQGSFSRSVKALADHLAPKEYTKHKQPTDSRAPKGD